MEWQNYSLHPSTENTQELSRINSSIGLLRDAQRMRNYELQLMMRNISPQRLEIVLALYVRRLHEKYSDSLPQTPEGNYLTELEKRHKLPDAKTIKDSLSVYGRVTIDEISGILSERAYQSLRKNKFVTIEDLVQKGEAELQQKFIGFGKNTLDELKTVLGYMGLSLGMKQE